MAAACPTPELEETEEWKEFQKLYNNNRAKAIHKWQDNGNEIPESGAIIRKDFVKNTGVSQQLAVKRLNDMSNKVAEEKVDFIIPEKGHMLSRFRAGDSVSRYRLIDGTTITGRVTDSQDKIFRKNKTKEQADEINNRPQNKIKAQGGTDLHSVIEEILSSIKEGREAVKPDFLNDNFFSEMKKGVNQYIANAQEVQNEIDPNGTMEIITETLVYDEKNDNAGTIDLLIIFSDGSAAIYDHKFVNFNTKNKKVVDFEDTLDMKEESWDIQISEYKKILKEVYGITTIRQSRVLPVNVQYKFTKKSDGSFEMTDQISNLEMTDKEYVNPIPVAQELTTDKKLNKLLSELMDLKIGLKNRAKSAKNLEAVKSKISRLQDSIRAIQVGKDFNYLIKEMRALNDEVNKYIGIEDPNDYRYLSNTTLSEYKTSVKVYRQLLQSNADSIIAAKKKNPELYKDFNTNISVAGAGGLSTEAQIDEKLKERMAELAISKEVYNLDDFQRETGEMGNYFKYLGDWTHPVFRTFKKLIDETIDNTRRDVNIVQEELKILTDDLKEWGKAHGKTGIDMFDPLINPDTGDLVAEFSQEFWKEARKQRANKNVKWFKDNYTITEEDAKKFEEDKKAAKERYDLFWKHKSEKWREAAYKRWLEKYDLKNSDEAWLGTFARNSLKNKAKWQSKEYKYIESQKPLKAYYDYYLKKNKEFSDLLPEGTRLKRNFVANISKDMMDTIAEMGLKAFSGVGTAFMQALEVREDDMQFGMIDPVTGEREYRIPILYTRPLTDNKGKVTPNLKSKDLSRSLMLFSQTVYNYQHVEKVESDINSLKEVLASSKQLVTDKYGKPYEDPATGQFKIGEGNQNSLEAFKTFINFYVYGQKTQNKDIEIKIGNKSLSGTKLLQMAMAGYGLKTLGFNIVSATANYIGATANMHMQARKGAYFNKKQLRQAHILNVTGDKKAAAMFKYFETEQDNLTYRKANELSASKIATTFTVDKAFLLQQKGDAAVDMNTTIAMMQNYGIDPKTSKIRKLIRLPEGTSSLWELSDIVNDKPVVKGLTEAQYNQFRRKVRKVTADIKGQYSKEDILMMNTHIAGQTIMQFRNWLPKMASERFRSPKFNEDMEEIELGRFKVFTGELLDKAVLPKIKNTLSILTEILSFSIIKHKLSEGQSSRYFDEFIANNPELAERINRGELERKDLFDMYVEARTGQIRAIAAEIRMYLITIGAIAVAGTDWDDDGEKLYQEIPGGKYAYKLIERTVLELGFWLRPTEATQLMRSPIPLMGLLLDVEGLISNTLDETRDVLFMEDYKGFIDWELDPKDKSPKLKYISRLTPFVNPLTKFFDYFDMIAEGDEE